MTWREGHCERTQVTRTAFDCLCATELWVTAKFMTDGLVFNTIILHYEGEGGGLGLIKLCIGSSGER